jgi:hypothetical protein
LEKFYANEYEELSADNWLLGRYLQKWINYLFQHESKARKKNLLSYISSNYFNIKKAPKIIKYK